MRFNGIGASEGIALGLTAVFRHTEEEAAPSDTAPSTIGGRGNIETEMKRFFQGRDRLVRELETLVSEAAEKIGVEEAGIFEGYIEIVMDDEIEESVRAGIANGMDAVTAINKTISGIAEEFAALEGSYMGERTSDLKDLGRRLSNAVDNREGPALPVLTEPRILAVDELSPVETVRLDMSKVLAIAADRGGKTGHAAILARSLGIPCVTGLGSFSGSAGDGWFCIVDGDAGIVELDPGEELIRRYKRLAAARKVKQDAVKAAAFEPAITKDGITFMVCANLGSPDEAESVCNAGADGVGLFRTEFLYMNSRSLPSEAEQYTVYTKALRMLRGKPLTVRTLDIGGDKDLPALGLTKEDNPFLGCRGIRISLERPDLFRPQIRALFRAAAEGPLHIMFPMVISVTEVRRLKREAATWKAELEAEGAAVGNAPIGIMIETPAAALMARELAAEADFFSIGTNDLTQYTLAVDRTNERIADLYDPFNPAVLRLIQQTCSAAIEAGIPASMCGEFASHELAVPLLAGFGLREFSVAAPRVPLVKAAIRRLDSRSCRALAQQVIPLTCAEEVREVLAKWKT
ncbi:MAG: phosphoenolpyruvate--protein phosphotransferase [Treponema sp.]|nr:phosphoenolpyruvate--protein phosphotransferase [Treponema sp.]